MREGPNFDRIRRALYLEESDRVPIAELTVSRDVKEAFLGKPVQDLETEVEFWATAGYDFVPLATGLLQVGEAMGTVTKVSTKQYTVYEEGGKEERTWAEMHRGAISTLEEFERYPWPDPSDVDYTPFEQVSAHLPEGMKVILILGKIYTPVWMMMGAETFFLSFSDNRELLEKMFDQIGRIQFEILQRAIEYDCIGAVCHPDDIAYTEGMLVDPDELRRCLFPWYRKMGVVCSQRDLPTIYHSDGDIRPVLEDLIGCGFNGLHPIEPKAMDIVDLKQRYGDQLCLIGNIDLGYTLTRGTPEEVAAEVKQRIKDLAPGGGYIVSSSNSVPEYVPLANYKAMIETARAFGRYPMGL